MLGSYRNGQHHNMLCKFLGDAVLESAVARIFTHFSGARVAFDRAAGKACANGKR